MKKLSERQKIHQLRRIKRRSRRREPKLRARSNAPHAVDVPGSPEDRVNSVRTVQPGLEPPQVMCIHANRTQCVTWLAELREQLTQALTWNNNRAARRRASAAPRSSRGNNIRQYWDYSQIKELTPHMALLIAAEYDRFRRKTNRRLTAVNVQDWQPSVFQAFEALGFFKILLMQGRGPAHRDLGGIRVLEMRSGESADPVAPGELIEELEELIADISPTSNVDFERLMGALKEGVFNAHEHAYPADRVDLTVRQPSWWITGAVDPLAGRLSIIVYDQGITIPASLPTSSRSAAVSRWIQQHLSWTTFAWDQTDDGLAIAAAMEVSKSATGHAYRGKGLHEMEAVMDTCASGVLRILSRRGEYIAHAKAPAEYLTHALPLYGTLIEWHVEL